VKNFPCERGKTPKPRSFFFLTAEQNRWQIVNTPNHASSVQIIIVEMITGDFEKIFVYNLH